MTIQLIQDRLNFYHCQSVQDEDHAMREISQEVILSALARSDFFKVAAFHGGTCLRLFYGLNRFSEDLDFFLKTPNVNFNLNVFLSGISSELKGFGYQVEVSDRSQVSSAVKKAFIKDQSIGKLLNLVHRQNAQTARKLKVKIEVDTNPPGGSEFENKYADFPYAYSVIVQDLPSLFAGKLHALLCRPYQKGRDWYDLLWYLQRSAPINLKYLGKALNQIGPWKDQNLSVNAAWCVRSLEQRIMEMDWKIMQSDIARFIKPIEQKSIELWSQDYFLDRLKKYSRDIRK